MNGLMTEREWRKRAAKRPKARPDWWGAQYMLPSAQRSLRQDRAFQLFLLLVAVTTAVLLPLFVRPSPREHFTEATAQTAGEAGVPRALSAVSYTLPREWSYQTHTYTRTELARGKLLVLDETHPLPREAPPPNTFSVVTYGRGMVPVAKLSVKSGKETITALEELFAALQNQGVSGLAVWEGTVSAAQQRARLLERLRTLMRQMEIERARALAVSETDWPSTGELLQEYAVELRFRGEEPTQPDTRPLESTRQGQLLLQLAWRYGFIRSAPQGDGGRPFRFRYVGRAHAMAMTYLNLTLEEYLSWLHRQGTLTISEGGKPKYLILCQPMSGTHVAFSLPVGAKAEASLDNLGYAVVACTLF